MHICLDFIAELLSQPDFQKQIFAIDLISNISQQYPLPKSLSLARLAINTMYTFLSGNTKTNNLIHFSELTKNFYFILNYSANTRRPP